MIRSSPPRAGFGARVAVSGPGMRIAPSLLAATLLIGLEAQAAAVTSADYARAERFLSWNAERFVLNGQIETHWIGASDQFWYKRRAGARTEFIVVDAASGNSAPAFDLDALTRALTLARSAPAEAGAHAVIDYGVPFEHFEFDETRSAITFSSNAQSWRCSIRPSYHCRPIPALARPGETLSPDRRWALFVQAHDLWVRSIEDDTTLPLTTNGEFGFGYGTAPEASTHFVHDLRQGIQREPQGLWSPDGRYFLSYQLDERGVGETFLVQSRPDAGTPRPRLFRYRMALPGDAAIPELQLVLFDVVSRNATRLAVPAQPAVTRTLFDRGEAWWSETGQLYVIERDRWAKTATLVQLDVRTGLARTLVTEGASTIAHINATTPLDRPLVRVLRSGDVIWYSQRNGFGHLYRYDPQGRLQGAVTHGDWNVRSIELIDEARGLIYFTASGREPGRDPYEPYLYSACLGGRHLRVLTPEPGDHSWPHLATTPSLAPDDREHRRSLQAAGISLTDTPRRLNRRYSFCGGHPVKP